MGKKALLVLLALMLALSVLGCAQTETTEEETVVSSDPVTIEAPEATPYETMSPDYADKLGITILYEQDDAMLNNYTLLAVNENAPFEDLDGNAVADVAINTVGAKALIDWMLGDEATELIGNYGFEQYGEYLFYNKEDRPVGSADIPQATDETKTIRLSTTTSVNDSGLMGYLLPVFEEEYGVRRLKCSQPEQARRLPRAMMGNADLILVHSKTQEEPFVEAGFSKVLDGYDSERLTFNV